MAIRQDANLDIRNLLTLQHYAREENVQYIRDGLHKAGFTGLTEVWLRERAPSLSQKFESLQSSPHGRDLMLTQYDVAHTGDYNRATAPDIKIGRLIKKQSPN